LTGSLLQMLPADVTPWCSLATQNRHVIAMVLRRVIARLSTRSASLRQSDVLIWGGGSLMQDATSAASPFYYGD